MVAQVPQTTRRTASLPDQFSDASRTVNIVRKPPSGDFNASHLLTRVLRDLVGSFFRLDGSAGNLPRKKLRGLLWRPFSLANLYCERDIYGAIKWDINFMWSVKWSFNEVSCWLPSFQDIFYVKVKWKLNLWAGVRAQVHLWRYLCFMRQNDNDFADVSFTYQLNRNMHKVHFKPLTTITRKPIAFSHAHRDIHEDIH